MNNKIANQQPRIYQTIKNATVNNKLAHAYLLSGPKSIDKLTIAMWIAKTIVCDNLKDGVACELCDSCLRITHLQYADLIVYQADEDKVGVEEIEHIKSTFMKTALEQKGKKIYIIKAVEKVTVAGLNKLLKFLEEPAGDSTYAILITDNQQAVLETIVSRCQTLSVQPITKADLRLALKTSELCAEDQYYVSCFVQDEAEAKEIFASDSYQQAWELFKQFQQNFTQDIYDFAYYLHQFNLAKKENNKLIFNYFIELCIIFIKDIIRYQLIEDNEYRKILHEYVKLKVNYQEILLRLLAVADQKDRSYNLSLMLDKLIYDLKEVIDGNN